MALNCIVDDSALLAGLKDPVNDNLQQWVREGLVNLFVPLYTLERLNIQRDQADSPSAADAQAVLQWLDYITSQTEGKNAGRVQLQGPDDLYHNWKDVERYLLPDTPLSSLTADTEDLADNLQNELLVIEEDEQDLLPSFSSPRAAIQGSNHSRSQSGRQEATKTQRENHNTPATIPSQVRPLLNFVVWRTQKDDESLISDRSNILLTQDLLTQKQASKFGVRAKLLHQVRAIVARDRQHQIKSGNLPDTRAPDIAESTESGLAFWNKDEDDDEVVFDPTIRPTSAHGGPDLIDPDHFGRNTDTPNRGASSRGRLRTRGGRQSFANTRGRSPTSPRASLARARGAGGRSPRGDFAAPRATSEARAGSDAPRPVPSRGEGGMAAARGGLVSARAPARTSQGQSSSNRGNDSSGTRRPGRGKGSAVHIDPDSFDRPPPKGRRGRGTLWQPS